MGCISVFDLISLYVGLCIESDYSVPDMEEKYLTVPTKGNSDIGNILTFTSKDLCITRIYT